MASEIVAHNSAMPDPVRLPRLFLPRLEVTDNSLESINDDNEKRLVAQRLHTDFLLEGGYITASDLKDGLYYDEYSQSSSYFMVSNESRTAACRCISAVGNDEGIGWLPTFRHFTLSPQTDKSLAGYETYMESLSPSEVIEVSALIATAPKEIERKKSENLDATHLLCSTVLRDSLDNGHKLWVMNIQENLRRSLNIFLGNDQVHRIGDPMFYHRPDAIPCVVEPEKAVQSMLSSKSGTREYRLACLRETMVGVSEQYLSDETIRLLHEVDISTSSVQISSESSSGENRTIGNLATRNTILS